MKLVKLGSESNFVKLAWEGNWTLTPICSNLLNLLSDPNLLTNLLIAAL